MPTSATLVVRIGAMGDIIHALPAVAALKQSQPDRPLLWLVAQRWLPLLEGNPFIDGTIIFDRSDLYSLRDTCRRLRRLSVQTAIDFQGLIKSAIAGRLARPRAFWGFGRSALRERPAGWFYTHQAPTPGPHRVERYLQLARAATHQSPSSAVPQAWIPPGKPEGTLPRGPFVLTTPFAGWAGKEWPLQQLNELGASLQREGFELVASVAPQQAAALTHFTHLRPHVSSLAGLIYATRQAAAVVAPDSGPLHLAAALEKPGVALFGPTDPTSNGPFGGSLTVLRAPNVETTYKRHRETHPSMRQISVSAVLSALLASLAAHESRTV